MTKRILALLCVLSLMASLFVGCDNTPTETINEFADNDQRQELINTREAFTPGEPLTLFINGVQAIYEKSKNAYFFSVSADEKWERLEATVEDYDTVYTTHFELDTKSRFLNKNRTVSLLTYDETHYTTLSIVFTSLPLLSIDTLQLPEEYVYHDAGEEQTTYYDDEGEPIPYEPYGEPPTSTAKPIGEYDTFLEMTLLDPLADEHGYENGFTSLARAHIRGRSSRKYPKNSYKLELLKEEDGVLVERDKTLLGMRADGDWNLNGMYAEPTKVRDKVAADLWLAITEDYNGKGLRNGYRCEYIEVIINNSYHGLYLLTERIDRKQLDLEDNDRLYFSEGDLGKVYQEFLMCDEQDMTVAGYSLDWPKERSAPYDEWVPFADLTKLVDMTKSNKFAETADTLMNFESLANYELFIYAAVGRDNLIQNTFYIARQQEDGSYIFEFMPWDLDQTFGNAWHGEEPLYTGEDYYNLVGAEMNFWVSRKASVSSAAYREIVNERYAQLRKTVLSTKNIQQMVEDANAAIVNSGAFMRNKIRWDLGAYEDDTTAINNFIAERMEYLDERYQ